MKKEEKNIDFLDELLRQHLLLDKESNLAEQVFNREVSYNPSPRKIKDFIGKMDRKTKYLGNTNLLKLKHILQNKAFLSIVFMISLLGIFLFVKNKPDRIISETGLNSQVFLHSNNNTIINDLTNTSKFHLNDTGVNYKAENDCLFAGQSDESSSVLQDSLNLSVDSISLDIDKTKNLFTIDIIENANSEKIHVGYNNVNKAISRGEFYLFFISKNQTKLSAKSVNTLDSISKLMLDYPKTELIII